MKKIRIKKLSLENFKGTQKASYDFGDNIVVVKGINGVGKSTIADAISWALFGVDKDGNAKFGIKTRDESGRIVPNVVNQVKLILNVDGEDVIIERALRSTEKRDGGTSNDYIYKIDGDMQTAGDFKKTIDSICPLGVWRMCSSPLMFVSMDWTEQRQMLTSMFGEPDARAISGGDKRFDFVTEELKKNSIEKIIKHLGYQRKEVMASLNDMPGRIEELTMVLPAKDDWNAVHEDLKKKETEYEELTKQLHFAEAGQGKTVEAQQRKKALDFAYKRKHEMETGASNKNMELATTKSQELKALIIKEGNAEENVEGLIKKIASFEEVFKRCNEHIQELEAEKLDGQALWNTVQMREWTWNDTDSYCQTCGQLLPADKIDELKAASQKRFNTKQAEDKKKLTEKAAYIISELKETKATLEQYKTEKLTANEELKAAKKTLADIQAERASKEEEQVLSIEEILANNPSYKAVMEQIKELEDAPTAKEENDGLKRDLEQKIATAKELVEVLRDRYSTKKQYDTIAAQIETLNKQKKTLQEQLDELEEDIANTNEYQRRACELLEAKVNENFKLVKWSMFRKQVDGTEKPWCECFVGGVPFSDLNTAMRINAGLDIVSTLKKYYNVDAPCIIDNAETILNPLYDGGQQIRLTVTKDVVIKIEDEN